MIRLLIVDDEEIITDGLFEVLSKQELEIDIYKAYSGEEALMWLRRTRFDIVLSDIAMPEIDGLSLMDEIRANWPQCKMIFLTGYSDFQSVYQAIQWPGIRYLLKSEGYNKLIEAVSRVVSEIHEELRTAALLQRSSESQNAFETLAAGNYVRHLVFEGGADETMADNFDRLRIGFEPTAPVLISFGSQSSEEPRQFYVDRQETAMMVKLLADSYLGEKSRSLGVIDRFGDLIWLVQPTGILPPRSTSPSLSPSRLPEAERAEFDRTATFLEGTFELVQEACRQSMGIQLSVAIAAEPVEWKHLHEAYEKLRESQHSRAGDGTRMVQTVPLSDDGAFNEGRWRFPWEKTETLTGHLEGGRRVEFLALFEELSAPAREGGWPSAYATELYYSVAIALYSYTNRWADQERPLFPVGSLLQMEAHPSWRERFAGLRSAAEELFSLRRHGELSRAITAIDKICIFIDEHIAEDLSLVRLADEIHLNPSYLSRLFKQEKGMKLSEYIDEARFAKAKELLVGSDLKISEIGACVGYEAPHSFTRVFKKWAGASPQEFRETR